MALMLGRLNETLREAGASDATARDAAEEVAAYEKDMAGFRTELALLRDEMRSEFRNLRWEVRLTYALAIAVLVKLFVS